MEPVVTARTIIRPWTDAESDVDRLFDIQSRWEVVRWLDDDPTVFTERAQAEAQVERYRRRTDADGPRGFWAIEERATGVVAGTVLLCDLPLRDVSLQVDGSDAARPGADEPFGDAELEIGWHLHPDATGRGLAREAASAVLVRAFALGVPAVHALMYVDNDPSARVALAIGLIDRGVVDDEWYPGPSRHFSARPADLAG